MMLHDKSSAVPRAIPTGISALDNVGLRWQRGCQYLILGAHRTGRTALLLEFAIRHIEMHSSNRVLLITEDGADAVFQRLHRREVHRLKAEIPDTKEPCWSLPSARAHLAQLHIQTMVDRRRLQLIPALAGSSGIRFFPVPAAGDRAGGAPTLVIVDGYSVARTPLDRLREMIRCSADGGQGSLLDAPPILLSVPVQTKARLDSKEWPPLPRWEREHLLLTAETTIMLQCLPTNQRMIYAHICWADPNVEPTTVPMEIDVAGAISTP